MKVVIRGIYHKRIRSGERKIPKSGKPPRRLLASVGKHYHNRPENFHPTGGRTTASLAVINEKGTRIAEVTGIAYCSMADEFDPAVGQALALERAYFALGLRACPMCGDLVPFGMCEKPECYEKTKAMHEMVKMTEDIYKAMEEKDAN